MKSATIHAP